MYLTCCNFPNLLTTFRTVASCLSAYSSVARTPTVRGSVNPQCCRYMYNPIGVNRYVQPKPLVLLIRIIVFCTLSSLYLCCCTQNQSQICRRYRKSVLHLWYNGPKTNFRRPRLPFQAKAGTIGTHKILVTHKHRVPSLL